MPRYPCTPLLLMWFETARPGGETFCAPLWLLRSLCFGTQNFLGYLSASFSVHGTPKSTRDCVGIISEPLCSLRT